MGNASAWPNREL